MYGCLPVSFKVAVKVARHGTHRMRDVRPSYGWQLHQTTDSLFIRPVSSRVALLFGPNSALGVAVTLDNEAAPK